jgi:hypothetical protein
MLYASLTADPDFSGSSIDNKVIFFDFALHNEIVRVDANDILYRLRKEAADEITRLRLQLAQLHRSGRMSESIND